jgi:alanine dehydrogenase
MPGYINEEKVKESIDISNLVDTIEEAFKSYYKGDSYMPPKTYLDVKKGDFRSMPAYVSIDSYEKAGVKWVNVHPENKDKPTVMASIILCEPETGLPEYFIEATELTSLRTGAVTGVATNLMTPEDVDSVGIVGAGYQSHKQLKSIMSVRDIEKVIVTDLDDEKADEFSQTYDKAEVGEIKDVGSCDVVCTVTPSTNPILGWDDLDGVSHINAIGADAEGKQELYSDILQNSNIIVDDFEQCSHSGEVSGHIKSNDISEDDIDYTLGQVAVEEPDLLDELTIFDSTGLAIQDISACKHII